MVTQKKDQNDEEKNDKGYIPETTFLIVSGAIAIVALYLLATSL